MIIINLLKSGYREVYRHGCYYISWIVFFQRKIFSFLQPVQIFSTPLQFCLLAISSQYPRTIQSSFSFGINRIHNHGCFTFLPELIQQVFELEILLNIDPKFSRNLHWDLFESFLSALHLLRKDPIRLESSKDLLE